MKRRSCILLCLALAAAAPLAAQSRKAFPLCLDPKFEADSQRLAGALVQAGYTVSRSLPASGEAMAAAVASFEAKAGPRDSLLYYVIGSAFHAESFTYLSGPGWNCGLDELFAVFDPLRGAARGANRYLVLDLCRVGPRPLSPGFRAGVGGLVEPPPGSAALVPASGGRLLSPDEDEGGLVLNAFLELLGTKAADPLGLLRALERRLGEAAQGRFSPRLYGQLLVEDSATAPSLWGLALGESPASVLAKLGLDPALAGNEARATDEGLSWKPQEGRVPARLDLPWRGFFDKEEAAARPGERNPTETDAILDLYFLGGKLGRVDLSFVSNGGGIAGGADPALRREAALRYLGARLARWERSSLKPYDLKTMFTKYDEYAEDILKLRATELFQGPGCRLKVFSGISSYKQTDRDSEETFGEYNYLFRLETEAAMGW